MAILICLCTSTVTMGQAKTVSWTWGQANKKDTIPVFDTIKINIVNIDTAEIENFLKKTIIRKVNQQGSAFNESLFDRIVNAKDADSAKRVLQSLKKDKKIVGFRLDLYLGTLMPDDSIFIKAYLGKNVDTSKVGIRVLYVSKKTEKPKQDLAGQSDKPGVFNTVVGFDAPGSAVFIPYGNMEAGWARSVSCCEFLTAPSLNKHTRWAITYDYNRQDPVAVWRRGNKSPGDYGCCGVSTKEPSKKGKKNKKKSDEVPVAAQIAEEAAKLEQEWLKLEQAVKGTILSQRAADIRTQMQALNDKITGGMTEESRKQALEELTKIKEEVDIVKAMSGVSYAAVPVSGGDKGCCSKVYCGIQTARMAPAVKRSTLISVINFHPYRDSFSLAISYDNHFGQDMATFNSVFATATGQGGTAPKAASKDTTRSLQSGGVAEGVSRGKEIDSLFTILRDELKWYYTSKIQQVHLDVKVVENGTNYIKQRMNEVLGITEYTSAGIVKRAEDLADDVSAAGLKLDDFFTVAREAAAWWDKVANYRIFDSKSVLVQNKDVMNIVLRKYTYGHLITSDEEATRSYYTTGGFKIDFSAGLFGNFMVDDQFTTKSVKGLNDTGFYRLPNGVVTDSILSITATTKDSIIRDDRGKFNIGPAVFAHFYWRTGWDINVSATIGLSVNQQALPRYLFGGSLLLGRDQRLVLTGGIACGTVKSLASGLKEGDKVQLSSYANSNLPTKDVWQNRWFVGVSWNFAGIAVGN